MEPLEYHNQITVKELQRANGMIHMRKITHRPKIKGQERPASVNPPTPTTDTLKGQVTMPTPTTSPMHHYINANARHHALTIGRCRQGTLA